MPKPGVAEYRLSPAAQRDLDAIWDHTALTWSIAQADAYVRTIVGDLDRLLLNPEVSRERREFRPPVRIRRSGSHLIIYRIEPGWLSVFRIVHARQNWADLLDE